MFRKQYNLLDVLLVALLFGAVQVHVNTHITPYIPMLDGAMDLAIGAAIYGLIFFAAIVCSSFIEIVYTRITKVLPKRGA